MVKPNVRYSAKVESAYLTESRSKGTPGIGLIFDTEDGQIEHTVWLTPATVKRAAKDLVTLGADESKLKSWTYLENIGTVISGHSCDITTFEDEYNGKKRVKVQWINPRRENGGAAKLADRTAALFGSITPARTSVSSAPYGGVDFGAKVSGAPVPDNGITDEDVPF